MLPLRAPCRLRSSCAQHNSKMPWFILCVWWTLLLVAAVDCINLPPIHWNQSNPMFKASNNDHIVEVNINDEIDFVCPYLEGEEDMYEDPNRNEFYIIYQVTRDEYDTCMLYTGKRKNLVVNCSTPRQRKRFTIIFERYSSIPHGQEYKTGEAYYFITTSTGQVQGLDNIHQGACHHNNMKLTIRVCCQETTLTTTPSPTTLSLNHNSSTTTRDPLLPSHPAPQPSRPSPHITRETPTATTTVATTSTALSSTTTRRTTPSTRTRWKYPTTDKFPSTKQDGGKKDENDNDYNHENEVLPNKEQLVNRATSLVRGSASLLILSICALLAHLVALASGHR